MAFKFFNIGKANEEIVRLESENNRLTTELSTISENSKQLESAAETQRKELTEAKEQSAAAVKELTTAKELATNLTKERDELKAIIAKPDGEIERRASARAKEITASLGQPPLETKPNANPATPSAQKNELKGLAKVQAAFAAQPDVKAALPAQNKDLN